MARLAAAGARVVVADVDEPAAQRVAGAVVKAGGTAEAVAVDVTNEGDVAGMVGTAIGGNGDGRLDVLVCSAAVEVRASLADTSDEEWQRDPRREPQGPVPVPEARASRPWRASGGGSAVLLGSVLGRDRLARVRGLLRVEGRARQPGQAGGDRARARQGARSTSSPRSVCEAGLFLKMVAQAPDPDAIKRMVAERTPMGRLGTADDVVRVDHVPRRRRVERTSAAPCSRSTAASPPGGCDDDWHADA